ncbi:CDP-alcohol phosphatidyltransferase family protein [Entamoeba histolytica HM-1:IMSS-B]|uniref:CDP-alcohol phosphatidyltransferase family protein n=6 Tax=Entamoeba histolytica TaxID=5759 RepID=C4M2J1_ENTH1|nr:CDP-alcohol phosphatidyltransferase family protein [Entamoeba histolytica HM-1:IMSS]EMD47047.1 choline/ethanolaminphosphotransferase, putative [Entamoeba histolytica KU27]EMH72149.1 CDP-alcohol phosphatidyltransferase family protein [Entamoeba histolytica HM-1:IMSS-B]EMS13654.1 choline/ethanolaminephosphotransferase, putative [Entamoeba histolytica HM-3:IMSS]ENY63854.1 choline/ethanolaminephosphotransferase, putative [Entamoeba histolytica HM-1:IMSS-A]GAT95496.1 CDP-alcohol phosphatidyltran|eukprot:XP_652068.1 CDP-alcohol phosphatidyltransferase family protein [Entamoeba histolytica HM-1:IMSS]
MNYLLNFVHDFSLKCPFFPEKSLETLKDYKYQAIDNSIVGKYFYQDFIISPVMNHLVPKWIAPNVITTSGGIFIVLALFTVYLSNVFGSFTHLIIGLLFYMYVLFDTLDGKQARKTGSGSPLGELMDHGVDVLVMGTLAIILCHEFMLDQFQTAYIYFIGFTIFYLPHWVQHQTGWMIFGPASNPIEMVHLYLVIEIIRTINGWTPEIVNKATIFGILPMPMFLMIFATIILGCTIVSSIIDVRNEIKKNQKGWKKPLLELSSFIATSLVALSINYIHIDNFICDQLRLVGSVCFVGMFVQWYIVTRLLHLPSPPLYINFYGTIIISFIINISYFMGRTNIVNIFAVIYFGHSFFWESALVINVIYYFSKYLHIHPFKITPKQQD